MASGQELRPLNEAGRQPIVYSDIPEPWLYGGMTRVCYGGLRWLGGVTIEGLENIPQDGRVIVAATHRGAVQELGLVAHILTERVGSTAMVATQRFWTPDGELGKWGKPICDALGALPVVQGVGFSPASFDRIDRILKDNGNLFIFPEGGVRPGRKVDNIHPGVAVLAARYGARIVTMAAAGLELNDFGNIHAVIQPAIEVEKIVPPVRESSRRQDRGRALKLAYIDTARAMEESGAATRIEKDIHTGLQTALDRAYELRDASQMNVPRRAVSRIIRERRVIGKVLGLAR